MHHDRQHPGPLTPIGDMIRAKEAQRRAEAVEVLTAEYAGNYHSDRDLILRITDVIFDARFDMKFRRSAITRLDTLMGIDNRAESGLPDEMIVGITVEEMKNMHGDEFTKIYPHCD